MRNAEKGMVLVLTLVILTIITALIVEFSYGVYTSSAGLHNWSQAQRLSYIARSAVRLAVATISDPILMSHYKTVSRIEIPVENIVEGFSGSVVESIEDENGKFNLNSLRSPLGQPDVNTRNAHAAFKRLLRALGLDEQISDRVVNWLVKESGLPRRPDEPAKDGYLDSLDELLIIKGIDQESYQKLAPFVTVYGIKGVMNTNINTASIPVIMSLAEGLTQEHARGIVTMREFSPFYDKAKITQAGLGLPPINLAYVSTSSSIFRIIATAGENGIRRTIQCVVAVGAGGGQVRYWIEM